jgi:hypothetical protein
MTCYRRISKRQEHPSCVNKHLHVWEFMEWNKEQDAAIKYFVVMIGLRIT